MLLFLFLFACLLTFGDKVSLVQAGLELVILLFQAASTPGMTG